MVPDPKELEVVQIELGLVLTALFHTCVVPRTGRTWKVREFELFGLIGC